MSDAGRNKRGLRGKGSALLFGPPSGRGRRFLSTLLMLVVGVFAGFILFDRVIMPRVVREGNEVRIPVVAGREQKQAAAILRSAGLDPVMAPGQHHSQVARGLVLDVSPPAGLSVKRGRQVFIIPSLGPINRRVPAVVGQSMRMARMLLSEAAMRVTRVDYAATDLVGPDQVLASAPEPGAPVPENGQISLLVSSSRTPVAYWMPNLDGRGAREAVGWLRAAGLRPVGEEDAGASQVVTAQNPAPGTPVWPGTKAELRFGAGHPRQFPDRPEHRSRPGARW
jgi:beta-lactam-binding protein with PASTA domain